MEAYIYKYTNKENGKTYIGSRSAYSGSCYDDFNINYFSSSKDKQFLEDMKNGLLIGEIVLVLNEENANKKILEIEYNMITDFWKKYGKQMSYNHYANGQFSNAGEHFSEEHKRKLSEANKGKQDGEKGPMYGKPGTMLGKHHSVETRNKISKKKQGVPCIFRNRTPVLCIESQQEYNDATDAGKALGIDGSAILKVCQGKRHTCGGYHWKFINN